jgi:hypothetical protein
MNAFLAMQRLQAFAKGKPLPRGATIHFPIAEPKDTLLLAFVKMGGESAPWGVAWTTPGKKPSVLCVGEPRNRDLVADMMAEFAPVLLEHVFHPEYSEIQIGASRQPRPLRQIWLPNSTHVEMLHFLSYAYTFAKTGTAERRARLNALGRAAGWLFRESQRPGQVLVMAATEALRESYTFPAEDIRQGHLGFLMAWLETKGGRDARAAAAAAAEQEAVATNMDPAVERETLESMVDAFNEARTNGDDRSRKRVEGTIGAVLEGQLRRRVELTERAYERLRNESRRTNKAVDELLKMAQDEHWFQYMRTERRLLDGSGEPVFIPSPETDRHPFVAGARYFLHEKFETLRDAYLLEDDAEMQQEAIASGLALRGRIVKVSDDGEGKKTRPVWTVETDFDVSLRLREGSLVAPAGQHDRHCEIRSIDGRASGGFRVELEVVSLTTDKSRKHPGMLAGTDPRLVGTKVTLLPAVLDFSRQKLKKLWQQNQPGKWVIKTKLSALSAKLPVEISEDLKAADQLARADDEE